MNWTSLFSTILGGLISSKLTPSSQQAQTQVDPLSPYRTGWANQLAGLMADPSQAMNLPGVRAQYNLGLDSLNRTLAAQGKNMSGAQLVAAQQYGQDFAGQQFMNYADMLQKLATPSPAAQLVAGNYLGGQQGFAGQIGGILGPGIVNMIGGLFGGGGSGGSGMPTGLTA